MMRQNFSYLRMPSRFVRFCVSTVSFGIDEAVPFDVRRKRQLINLSVIGLIFGGFIRSLVALFLWRWDILPFHFAFLTGGLIAFGFILRGRFRTGAAVGLISAAATFSSMGWRFHNGMEELLLLLIAVLTFLFDSRPLRHLLFLSIGGLYAVVRIANFDSHVSSIPLLVFSFNTVFFVLAYCWFLSVFHEIYEGYRREIDRKNAILQEANQAKEKLFSIIAHDFLGPIGNLKTSLDFLDQGILTPEDFKRYRGALQEDVGHVLGSMKNLLSWATEQLQQIKPQPQAISLRATADKAIQLLSGIARRKGIVVENRIAAEASAWADPNHVDTVYRNLLSNALKFTPAGGRIDLIASEGGEACWHLAVRDTGVGIGPERLQTLFLAEHCRSTPGTERESGLGLGLRICREFVEKNGGTIRAESTLGQGTTIHFTLPKLPGLPDAVN